MMFLPAAFGLNDQVSVYLLVRLGIKPHMLNGSRCVTVLLPAFTPLRDVWFTRCMRRTQHALPTITGAFTFTEGRADGTPGRLRIHRRAAALYSVARGADYGVRFAVHADWTPLPATTPRAYCASCPTLLRPPKHHIALTPALPTLLQASQPSCLFFNRSYTQRVRRRGTQARISAIWRGTPPSLRLRARMRPLLDACWDGCCLPAGGGLRWRGRDTCRRVLGGILTATLRLRYWRFEHVCPTDHT